MTHPLLEQEERTSEASELPPFRPLRIVVALGGNAIQPPHTPGTAERLQHNLEQACAAFAVFTAFV